MKTKFIFFLISILLFALISCQSEIQTQNSSEQYKTSTENEISVNYSDISVIDEYMKLELSEIEEPVYSLIKAFLDKDTEKLEELGGYKKGMFDGYRTLTIGEYTITRDKNNRIIFSFKITSSGLDTLPVGDYSYKFDFVNSITFTPIEPDIKTNLTPAQYELAKWFNCALSYAYTGTDVTEKDEYSAAVSEYLTSFGPLTKEQIKDYALKLFNISDFQPTGIGETDKDGLYHGTVHGGNYIAYDIISESDNNNITTITVQYYADMVKTIKSHTVEYKLRQVDDKWAFIDHKFVFKSLFEPMIYCM